MEKTKSAAASAGDAASPPAGDPKAARANRESDSIPPPSSASKFPPWAGLLATALIYVVGLVTRWVYIFKLHDPRKYVYSDMKMYVDLAKRLSLPNHPVGIGDITHPPGNTWLLMWFFQHYPTPATAANPNGIPTQFVAFQFFICALVPIAMGALGWVTFGKKTALASVCVSSAYFAFIDFGGYILAEIHLTLVATLCIAAYLYAMKLLSEGEAAEASPKTGPYRKPGAEREKPAASNTKRYALIAASTIVGGVLFSIAMALKMVAMPGIAGFCIVHFLVAKRPNIVSKAVVFSVFMLAAAPITGVMVHRCTKANEGQFCTGSNKSAADFLLGHYGRIQGIEWHDPKTRSVIGFGNPSAYQHGYRSKEIVNFAITDQKANNGAAFKWIKANPGQAVILSFEHVWDSFGGAYPWPPNATGVWPWSYAFHFLFLAFMIFPALVRLVDVLRTKGVIGFIRSEELILLSPIFGVCLAQFVASGEVRYRIPWDGVFIVLGVEFYRRAKFKFWEPKPALAGAAAVTEPAPSSDDEDEDDAEHEAESASAAEAAKPAASDAKKSAKDADAEVDAKSGDDEPADEEDVRGS